MKVKEFIIILLISLLGVAGLFWSFMPVIKPPQGIHSTDWTAADLILDRCKFCVVNPRSIQTEDDFNIHFLWAESEIKARGLIVIIPWSLAVGMVVWKRKKRNGPSKPSDKVEE